MSRIQLKIAGHDKKLESTLCYWNINESIKTAPEITQILELGD